ncbi:MAG: hypothetical protein CSB47_05195 [Proteobacteria bacterium]|nr:MAG: hypothetical protein CSB47_05195 [Pseudomonadota bacterium]
MVAEQAMDPTEATDSPQESLSVILTRHREEHGLNINQVAEALCLSPKIMMALEAEKLDELPEPPYVRGYLRSFAKFVEVEPTEIIAAYEKLRGAKPNDLDYHFAAPPVTSQKKYGASSGMLKVALLALLVGLLAILSMIPGVRDWVGNTWNSFSEKSEPAFTSNSQNDNPLLTGNIPAPLPIGVDDDTSNEPFANEGTETPPAGTEVVNNGFPSVADTPTSTESTSDDAQAGEPAATEQATTTVTTTTLTDQDTEAPVVPEGSSALKLVFNDEVWMRIRTPEKKKLFEALSQKGDTKELVLPRPMVVRVGNAQNLELTIDGKIFDMAPFTRGSVANFTIE